MKNKIFFSISSSRSALALVLLALKHSHIALEVTYIPINNLYIGIWHHRLVNQPRTTGLQASQYFYFHTEYSDVHVYVQLHCRKSKYHSVQLHCQKSKYHSVWLQKMGNSCTSVSQTLAHGNSDNKIRQREGDKRRMNMERVKWAEKIKSQWPKLQLRPIFPRGCYAPKQQMNFLTNQLLQSICYPLGGQY